MRKRCAPTFVGFATRGGGHKVTVAKTKKKGGLQYAYHNHNFEFKKLQGGQSGYDILLTKTDPEAVAFELDCGWAVSAGVNPADYFVRNPGRFWMLDVKDFVAKPEPIFRSLRIRAAGYRTGPRTYRLQADSCSSGEGGNQGLLH
ncbi:hypothetical protein RBB78_24640 [Tunturiibacter empetritectus]|uniref:hypothetical protein n=1 Tax=Tunturiibacter empetritectus TaxID=3069691 RepID=UPI003D9AD222